MDYSHLTQAVVDNVIVPVVLVIASAVMVYVKSYVQKITDSMIAKNKVQALDSMTAVKNNLLADIGTVVQAAVSSNMSLADTLKARGDTYGLSDDDVAMLQKTARDLIYQTLPPDLLKDDSPMLQIIGGKDRLDAIINGMLEHYVIEAKAKMAVYKQQAVG